MVGTSDNQVLEHFKQVFPPKIEVQWLEIEDIDVAIGKLRVFIFFFKIRTTANNKLFYILTHMTEKSYDKKHTNQTNQTNSNIFHKEGLKKDTSRAVQNTVIV